MSRYHGFLTLFCFFIHFSHDCSLLSAEPQVVEDIWEVAQVGKAKAGFFHTRIVVQDSGDQKIYTTTQELNLRVKRFGSVAQLRMVSGTDETKDGKVVGAHMRMFRNGNDIVTTGKVKGKTLVVEVKQGSNQFTRRIPWKDEAIGLYAQERFFQENRLKPGMEKSFQTFEPTLNSVITMTAKVGKEEEVTIFGAKRKLQVVQVVPGKVVFQGRPIPLPTLKLWINDKGVTEQRQVEIPPLGKVLFTRTSKEVAMAPGASLPELTDIGLEAMIPVSRRIFRPHDTKSVLYRITVKGDDDPKSALTEDVRQSIRNGKGESFDLLVQAVREPKAGVKEIKADEKFLKNCYFLNCDDGRIQSQAKEAVGRETDPLKKARLIERWVYRNVRNDNSVPFNTAGQIAKQLRGDCRQHAMLAAAMCRAVGVPSRTAVGLIYVQDRRGRPSFGFHMWMEAWVKGQWISLDATLGRGSIGAGHIKIADHSWHDTQSLTPMLPVARVLGRLKIDVVKVEN